MFRYIYIYIYIYIIHRQTVSLNHNSSIWIDTWDASSRDRNPAKFNIISHPEVDPTQARELNIYVFNSFSLNFMLSKTEGLNF